MKFTTFTTIVFPVLSLLFLTAFGAPLESRDVYVPPVISPKEGTVLKVGEKVSVIWNVQDPKPPKEITNPNGQIFLRKGDRTNTQNVLAEGFSILLGNKEVTVPQVEDGDDYRFVLFGDSGNFSPSFSIRN